MAESKKNKRNDYFESFVWKPRPACCLKADGSRDYEKLMALLRAAQDWDHEAQMRIFEQYSGVWQPLCYQSEEVMYRLAMDYEDFQSEAFICFMKSLKIFDSKSENFKDYFLIHFKNVILNLFRDSERQVIGHGILSNMKRKEKEQRFTYSICSLQERDFDGNLKYDISDAEAEKEYFKDYFPQASKLLTEQELQIAIYHYIKGFSIKATSKYFALSSRKVDNIIKSIKTKLKILHK